MLFGKYQTVAEGDPLQPYFSKRLLVNFHAKAQRHKAFNLDQIIQMRFALSTQKKNPSLADFAALREPCI